ncbi:NUDIX hydrolase [Actinopolyspora erythraea]|uniref:NUDIX hydrolase n=1 Tax=Actinopolyspora erythraea TaxID=414996 RepID=UPI00069434C3|nr:NUDIX hydrolase [Actinopolyspora erythraea]
MLRREGGWLLLRRRRGRYLGGCWDIPGGTVEVGERLSVAARREVLEETGSRVEIGAVAAHHTNEDTEGRRIRFHTVTFHAAETEPGGPVVLSPEEHERYGWFGSEAALALNPVWHVRWTLSALAASEG